MKIAIHDSAGSFSDRWIPYCKEKNIPYKIVNCYHSDIMHHLSDCEALMWHFHHSSTKDFLFAKQLLFAVEAVGKKVFPDFNTAWHFDDKVGQKYLLEGKNLRLVPSYVFYDEKEALTWASNVSYPKVFKLRGGAGSQNVRLVNRYQEAESLIERAFGKGFRQYDSWGNLKERYQKYRYGKTGLRDVFKGLVRIVHPPKFSTVMGRQRGYIYFQDFIPGNEYDIRVVVIKDKAFAIKRLVRPNDFRASGSGLIYYERKNFADQVINLSFETAFRLKSQCLAIDFVCSNEDWLIVEVSYGFAPYGYDPCVGYWDSQLNFHEGKFNPYGWMVDHVLN